MRNVPLWKIRISAGRNGTKCTYGREDWNAQPQRVYSIKNSNLSKASNKYPESSFDHENRLYELEEEYSIDQTFHVYTIFGKCERVHIYVSRQENFQKWRESLEITHKLELRGHQSIQISEGR